MSWLVAGQFDGQGDHHTPKPYVRQAFRKYLECGIFAHGFARAKEMLGYQHSGFSVDAGVCIEAHDRAALERLLRYCARPPFAMDRLRKEGAALVPPPRTHRHRYFGVLAPNSPLRAAAVLAAPAQQDTAQPAQTDTGVGVGVTGVAPVGNAAPTQPEPVPPKRSPAHYLWAVLIARFLSPCGTDRSYAQRTSSVLN